MEVGIPNVSCQYLKVVMHSCKHAQSYCIRCNYTCISILPWINCQMSSCNESSFASARTQKLQVITRTHSIYIKNGNP